MTYEQQNLTWQCLPAESKKEVKQAFSMPTTNEYEQGYDNALVSLFGIHNLTSDAEGEEMLSVKINLVKELYQIAEEREKGIAPRESEEEWYQGYMKAMQDLFGSKCLPDVPSSEPKFKYKEGDNVVRYCDRKVYVVVDYCEDDNINHYSIVDALGNRYSDSEGNLKLYERPKYCIGQKVRYKGQNHEIGEIAKYWGDEDPGRYSVRFGKEYHNISENMLDPYEEPKPAEPNYEVGDKIRIVKGGVFYGRIGEVTDIDFAGHLVYYKTDRSYEWLKESDLEPYTEPEVSQMKPIESKVSVYLATKEEEEEFRLLLHENGFKWNTGASLKGCSFWVNNAEESKILYVHPDKTVTYYGENTSSTLTFPEFKKRYFGENVNLSQNIENLHKQFDNILKDNCKNHNRLHIATIIAAGWIAHDGPKNMDPDIMAADSLTIADTLIAEAEKGVSK